MIIQFQLHDIFATKGLEYLLIIGYLLSFIFFWRYLDGRGRRRILATHTPLTVRMIDWFRHADELFYHPGHAWARPSGASLVRIGMDDFAHKLLGQADSIRLPEPGSTVRRGEVAWHLNIGSASIPMLAPVNGKVVSVNPAVASGDGHTAEKPYSDGWLLEVQAPRLSRQLNSLLSGAKAHSWMEGTVERLADIISDAQPSRLGVILQDGGTPLTGFAREIRPDGWEVLVQDFLMTSDHVSGSKTPD